MQSRHGSNGSKIESLISEKLKDLQREKVEGAWEGFEPYLKTISNAVKSAVEEGVSKRKVIDSLGLNDIGLEQGTVGLSKAELDLIIEELGKSWIRESAKS
ncbi:MAG: hypothetical protein M1383_00295 [Patescibacteria group bacterium]|nr:hypothetical protein [Patescibacteria group bacterium]